MSLKQNLFNKILIAIVSYICGVLSILSALIISEGIGLDSGNVLFYISAIVLTIVLFAAQFICLGILFSMIPFISFFSKEIKYKSLNEEVPIKNDQNKIEQLKKTIKIK